jgi:hypothetical protein
MLAAWKTLLFYTHYDFGSGLDFNIQQLKKGLTSCGPLSEKLYAGNDMGSSHGLGKAINVHLFVVCRMPSSNKTPTPSESTKMKDWKPHM